MGDHDSWYTVVREQSYKELPLIIGLEEGKVSIAISLREVEECGCWLSRLNNLCCWFVLLIQLEL